MSVDLMIQRVANTKRKRLEQKLAKMADECGYEAGNAIALLTQLSKDWARLDRSGRRRLAAALNDCDTKALLEIYGGIGLMSPRDNWFVLIPGIGVWQENADLQLWFVLLFAQQLRFPKYPS